MNKLGFLQKTQCFHDSMNRPKIEFITYIYIYYLYLVYRNEVMNKKKSKDSLKACFENLNI